jgi:hypothetical protein
MQFDRLRRRKFIMLLGGRAFSSLAAWGARAAGGDAGDWISEHQVVI